MSLSKFDSVWNFMSEFDVVPTDNSNYDKLKCLICEKIMTDACQSHCGCQYCFKCFLAYQGNENKYCPGSKEDCKEEPLVLDLNVFKNAMLNKKISKIKVNCPNQYCDFSVELVDICDHLRLCSKQPIDCPYVRIGCCDKKENKEAMLVHLGDESLSHTELLIDCLNNLKEDSLNNERRMTTIDDNLVTIKNDIEVLRRNVGNILIKMEADNCGLRREIDIMKEKIETTNSENDIIRRQIKTARGESANLLTVVNRMREKMENYDEERERKIIYWIKWSKLCPNLDEDFVWKMEQCSKNIDKSLYSESFYSNNYKLCLRLCIRSDDNIRLRCFIVKGDNDDKIEWPMILAVTLSIVNQDSLRPYKSETFQYDTFNTKESFNKPTTERNYYSIGTNTFTKYSSIKGNISIITNDSIVVSCALSRL